MRTPEITNQTVSPNNQDRVFIGHQQKTPSKSMIFSMAHVTAFPAVNTCPPHIATCEVSAPLFCHRLKMMRVAYCQVLLEIHTYTSPILIFKKRHLTTNHGHYCRLCHLMQNLKTSLNRDPVCAMLCNTSGLSFAVQLVPR